MMYADANRVIVVMGNSLAHRLMAVELFGRATSGTDLIQNPFTTDMFVFR